MALANTTRDKKERVGRMYLMHADDREQIKEAFAGDIVALAGLKDTRTGETLSDPNKPVLLEKMDFPNPVIEMKIEPKTKADVEKMGVALAKLAAEDPSFRVTIDQESGETIIKGMGELHLEIKVDILKRTHKRGSERRRAAGGLSRDFGARDRGRLHAQEADRRHGPVRAREAAAGAERARRGQRVRERDHRRRRAQGIHSGRREGRAERLGFRRADRLPDGRHEGDAVRRRLSTRWTRSAIAFEIASRQAMREGCNKAGVKLLEPIMDVEVVTPGDFVGGVIGDINSRRGQIRSQEMRGNATVVRANVPLANMFGYVSQLRSMSQGARHVHDAVRALRRSAAQRGRRGQGEVRLRRTRVFDGRNVRRVLE